MKIYNYGETSLTTQTIYILLATWQIDNQIALTERILNDICSPYFY